MQDVSNEFLTIIALKHCKILNTSFTRCVATVAALYFSLVLRWGIWKTYRSKLITMQTHCCFLKTRGSRLGLFGRVARVLWHNRHHIGLFFDRNVDGAKQCIVYIFLHICRMSVGIMSDWNVGIQLFYRHAKLPITPVLCLLTNGYTEAYTVSFAFKMHIPSIFSFLIQNIINIKW